MNVKHSVRLHFGREEKPNPPVAHHPFRDGSRGKAAENCPFSLKPVQSCRLRRRLPNLPRRRKTNKIGTLMQAPGGEGGECLRLYGSCGSCANLASHVLIELDLPFVHGCSG